MKKLTVQYYKTPVGELILGSFDGKLCLADWRYRKMRTTIDKRITSILGAEYIESSSEAIEAARTQLEEYFKGKRKEFDIPMLLAGTDFQKKVWNTLIKVPYGKTESYSGLAKLTGSEKAVRAVASANGANAISIIIPCHRIIGSDGSLTGYAGGLNAKKKLLEIESQNKFF